MSKVKPGAGRKMWIKALRSGKYQQGFGSLKDRNAYCCLGVACDVFSQAKSRGGEFQQGGVSFAIGDDNGAGHLVNKQVADWVGITHNQINTLVTMNDCNRSGFGTIADYVEGLPVLNPNAQKLIDALRSSEYEQNQGALRNASRYCCLGVACDLYAKEHSDTSRWAGNGFRTEAEDGSKGMSMTDCLPEAVRDWLGFKDAYGGFPKALDGEGKPTHLAWLNDHGKTFDDIADIIESSADGLFADELSS